MSVSGVGSRHRSAGESTPGGASGSLRPQIAHPNQVVSRRGEGEHPSDYVRPSEPRLALPGNRLHPPEDFLDTLPFSLTNRVPRPTGGPSVDRTPPIGIVLRHMRGDSELPHLLHEVRCVVATIRTQRDRLLPPGICFVILIAASRSAVPVASVTRVFTTSPLRFSVRICPRYANFASLPRLFLYRRASGSVVD
jgi:hypothetical protein